MPVKPAAYEVRVKPRTSQILNRIHDRSDPNDILHGYLLDCPQTVRDVIKALIVTGPEKHAVLPPYGFDNAVQAQDGLGQLVKYLRDNKDNILPIPQTGRDSDNPAADFDAALRDINALQEAARNSGTDRRPR